MIRLGLRLTVAGGREAITRLVIISAAVAVGVALLLAIVAGANAVDRQNARYAWLATGEASAADPEGREAADPLWWLLREDYFDGRTIARVDLAPTGPDAALPPGIPRLPGPGEFYASPALSALLDATPAAQLADRYPGTQVGTVGRAALLDPESLVIMIGRTPDALAQTEGAERITRIATEPPGVRADALRLILAVVAAGLLFPVLVLIGTATRLSATRREQRFAAMRLVGATPRQVSVVSAVESTVAAVVGTVLGFGLFALLRGQLAEIPFTGAPFFDDDLVLGPVGALVVALGVPLGAGLTARLALRRVRISPFGVTRRATPRPPRAIRLVPLLLGIAELASLIAWRPRTSDGQVAAYLSGFLLVMTGLVVAGPWLTMVGARLLAQRARRPSALLAARRLADDPHGGFRAVSGLVLALFVMTAAVAIISAIVAQRGSGPEGAIARTTLARTSYEDRLPPASHDPDAVAADLRTTAGVRSATVVRRNPAFVASTIGLGGPLPGLVSCADLDAAGDFGACADGAEVAEVWPELIDWGPREPLPVWPSGTVPADDLAELPLLSVVVGTDGSAAAIEEARTVLEVAYPDDRRPPSTDADFEADFTRALAGWRQLALVVVAASLPIAGCSLAVSVAGGLSERKRPFSLLRLSGVPLRVLRRVVALESAVPLLVVAAVAIGTGFLAAQLFLRAQLGYTLEPPGPTYVVLVLAGLVASLGIIASTLPLLERITGPETARNE